MKFTNPQQEYLESLSNKEILSLFGYRQNKMTDIYQETVQRSVSTTSLARKLFKASSDTVESLVRIPRPADKSVFCLYNERTANEKKACEVCEGDEALVPSVMFTASLTVNMVEFLQKRSYLINRVIAKATNKLCDDELRAALVLLDASSKVIENKTLEEAHDDFNSIKSTKMLAHPLTWHGMDRSNFSTENDELLYKAVPAYQHRYVPEGFVYMLNDEIGEVIEKLPVISAHGDANAEFKSTVFMYEVLSMWAIGGNSIVLKLPK